MYNKTHVVKNWDLYMYYNPELWEERLRYDDGVGYIISNELHNTYGLIYGHTGIYL